jgi:hypothetical protein
MKNVNTKTKSVSFYAAYLIKKLWALVALSLVVVAVTISVVRYSLPYMNVQKHLHYLLTSLLKCLPK